MRKTTKPNNKIKEKKFKMQIVNHKRNIIVTKNNFETKVNSRVSFLIPSPSKVLKEKKVSLMSNKKYPMFTCSVIRNQMENQTAANC